ncbi:MAG: hypothetical protein JXA66_02750, partial [Oligoflexia bacterium]|nr:hypothetical protein [Oligoflexia bacterium]
LFSTSGFALPYDVCTRPGQLVTVSLDKIPCLRGLKFAAVSPDINKDISKLPGDVPDSIKDNAIYSVRLKSYVKKPAIAGVYVSIEDFDDEITLVKYNPRENVLVFRAEKNEGVAHDISILVVNNKNKPLSITKLFDGIEVRNNLSDCNE